MVGLCVGSIDMYALTGKIIVHRLSAKPFFEVLFVRGMFYLCFVSNPSQKS
jgi:hypothetical protein